MDSPSAHAAAPSLHTPLRGLQNIDNDYLQPPVSRPFETTIQDDMSTSSTSSRNIRRRLAREESPRSEHSSMDIDVLPPAIQLARARESYRNEYSSSSQEEGKVRDKSIIQCILILILFFHLALIYVSEPDLLRDLIFIFQGIDGQYIKFNQSINDYGFIPGVSVSIPMQEMVFKLADIGWLYIKIRDFIKQNVDNPTIGLVGQSLCAALQHELTQYYKLIAILEAQIEKQIANKASAALEEQKSLTLKRLMVWTLDCTQKLRLMSILVDVCQGNTII